MLGGDIDGGIIWTESLGRDCDGSRCGLVWTSAYKAILFPVHNPRYTRYWFWYWFADAGKRSPKKRYHCMFLCIIQHSSYSKNTNILFMFFIYLTRSDFSVSFKLVEAWEESSFFLEVQFNLPSVCIFSIYKPFTNPSSAIRITDCWKLSLTDAFQSISTIQSPLLSHEFFNQLIRSSPTSHSGSVPDVLLEY
jgi:hypothetical protein